MAWRFYKSNGAEVGTSVNHFICLTPSGAIIPASNGARKAQVNGTNLQYCHLEFDKDTDESAYWEFIVPGNMGVGPWTIKVYWLAESETTGDATFDCQYLFVDDSETYDAALTNVDGTPLTADGTAKDVNISTITIPSVAAAEVGKLCVFRLYRDISAADDFAEDADVVMVKIEYTGA